MTQIVEARKGNITPEMEAVARAESVSVEHVRDGHDAADERDVRAGDAGEVAVAVPALVMRQRNLLGHLEEQVSAA